MLPLSSLQGGPAATQTVSCWKPNPRKTEGTGLVEHHSTTELPPGVLGPHVSHSMRTWDAHTQGRGHPTAQPRSAPTPGSASTCSDKGISVRGEGEGRGQTRTSSLRKASMFGPQLDFQASQGTEWVFRVSFLLIQLNSMFYCSFPDPRYPISSSCCVLQTNSADLVLRQDTSALLPTPETQPKNKQTNKKPGYSSPLPKPLRIQGH